MTQEAQETQTQAHEKAELRLSRTVTALVDAVEDMSKHRPSLGVVHLEKGKATVADGFALVQVEDESILLEGVLDVPFSVLKPHHGQDVTVTTQNAGTISVAREIKGVTHKTEAHLPTTMYPEVTHLVANALGNSYPACVALDVGKLKRLLKVLSVLRPERVVRLYIPTNPTQPILLVMSEGRNNSGNIKVLLMPMYVDWSSDGIKKEATGTIKYEKYEEEKP